MMLNLGLLRAPSCPEQTVQYYSCRKTPVYTCFLDLSKAFDIMGYDLLWKKLKERGGLAGESCW